MSQKMLNSGEIGEFCGGLSSMISVGIQLDEALCILYENSNEPFFSRICNGVHAKVVAGMPLSLAISSTGAFPQYVISSISAGEESGQLEEVLDGLARYYVEESKFFVMLRRCILYPAILFCFITAIIAFTIYAILPVFYRVYEGFVGDLAASSFSSLEVSVAIGWVALAIAALCAIFGLACYFAASTIGGRARLLSLFEKIPFTRQITYRLALGRFLGFFSIFSYTEVNIDEGMRRALELVSHKDLHSRLEGVYASMTDLEDPKSFSQAVAEHEIFEASHSRMISVGSVNGNLSEVTESLSEALFDDAIARMNDAANSIEPIMALFMTLAISATLIAVMLPLIGIVGSLS